MNFPWRCIVASAALALSLLRVSTGIAAQPEAVAKTAAALRPLPLLTNAAEVRNLSREKATLQYPVRITGAVTYNDPEGGMLFVQDGSAGIYVSSETPLKTNIMHRQVIVTGRSGSGGFAPIIDQARIEVIGPAPRLPADRVSIESVMTGQRDSQLVEVLGIVRAVVLKEDHLYLDMVADRERFTTDVPHWKTAVPTNLVDAALRVRGVCGTEPNSSRQILKFKIHAAEPEDITVESLGSTNLTIRPIESVLGFNGETASGHRVRVKGVVLGPLGTKGFFVRDKTGSIVVLAANAAEFRRGDPVVATGFPMAPRLGTFTPLLEDAEAIAAGGNQDLVPDNVSGTKLFQRESRSVSKEAEKQDGKFIEVAATLDGRIRRAEEHVLVLRQGPNVFNAIVPAASKDTNGTAGKRIAELKDGSELRLRGVCQIRWEPDTQAKLLRLWLQSEADVEVMRDAPWWNTTRVSTLLSGVGVLLAAIAGWASLLRRQVRRRTGELGLANKQLHEQIAHSAHVAESLAVSEARHRAIIDAEPDCVMVLEANGRVLEMNRAGHAIIEADTSADGQANLVTLAHPDWRAAVSSLIAAVLEGQTRTLEVEMNTLRGRRLWADLHAAPLRDAQGDIKQVLVLMRDISNRRRNETELRLKTAVLEDIAEAMTTYLASRSWTDAASVLLRAALRVTMSECGFAGVTVNGAVRVIAHAGFDQGAARAALALSNSGERGYIDLAIDDKVTGVAVKEGRVVIHEGAGEETMEKAARAERRVLPEEGVVGFGGTAFRRFLVVPVRIGTEVVGVLAVANGAERYSAADEKHMEDLSRVAGLLHDSHRRAEREGGLQAQLRQAQKMEAIGQLAAGVAHDFNNLLTVIRGRAELLTLLSPDGPAAHAGREISAAADRAANLTRQLLTFSRKQPMQLAAIDLNSVVQNLSRMLHRLLREDITIQLRYGAALPPIVADAGMIEQIILNLGVNARDAMPNGGELAIETQSVTIDEAHVREHTQARAGDFVCLLVSDTGSGMSPEVLAHIFEPFFTTKEIGKGTGLGLATIYGIVQQHRGWIEVKTAPGQGSTFRVYFPAEIKAAPAPPAPPDTGTTLAGSETVLVVEDEPGVRELVRGVLERFGYRVLMAQSGVDALGVWDSASGAVDIVMTDIVMPEGISGIELARRLQRRKPSVKIIFTSGYSVHLSQIESQLRPGIEFLPKPYEVEKLARCVRRCLDASAVEKV